MSKFIIEIPKSRSDNIGIGEAQLQTWIDTYQNAELGIDEKWIRNVMGFLTEDKGINFRETQITLANRPDTNILYRIVKDDSGKVVGFLHASRDETAVRLNAIYLLKEAQGTGVAQNLMQEVITFANELPIHLDVAAYNAKAIHFYEKFGFKQGELSKELFHERMPILTMNRKGE